MEKKTSINLYIAKEHFALSVTNKEEEILREATKLLNEEIEKLQKEVNNRNFSQNKIMAGAALQLVSRLLRKCEITGRDRIENELEELRIMLEDSVLEV